MTGEKGSTLSRTIISSSAAFSISTLACRFISVFLLPVYTRYLSTADYGVLELLDLTLTVFTTLFGLELASSIYYYAAKEERRERTYSTAIVGSLIVGLLAAFLGILNSSWVSLLVFRTTDFAPAFRLYFSGLVFSLFAEAGLSRLRADQRIKAYNWAVVLRFLFQAALNLIFMIVFRMGYYSVLWSTIISAGATGAVLAGVFYWRHPLVFDGRQFLGMVRYSLPLGLNGIAMLVIHFGDRVFLQRWVPLSAIGVYALAYKLGMMTALIHGPFVTYWAVAMFSIVKREDGDRVYVRVFTHLALVMSIAGALLAIFSRPLVKILLGPEYQGAAAYVPWITLAYVLRSLGDHLRSPFFIKARTGLNSLVSLTGAAVCLAGYSVLIPRWGVWGAVAATLLAFAVMLLAAYFAAQRVLYYRFEYGRLGVIALLSSVACLFMILLPLRSLPAVAAAGTVVAGGLVAALLLSGFLKPEEKKEARNILAAARKFALQMARPAGGAS